MKYFVISILQCVICWALTFLQIVMQENAFVISTFSSIYTAQSIVFGMYIINSINEDKNKRKNNHE